MKRSVALAVIGIITMLFAKGASLGAEAQPEQPKYHISKVVPLGPPDRWDYVVFDPESHRVYVAHGDRVTVVALILPLVAIWLFGGYENFEWVDQPITFMQGLGIMVPMFFPFGVFFYAQSRWNMARARASRRWPTVPAVVQADEVEQRQSSFFVFYKLALRYRYEVGGTSYEGDRVQFGPARVTARELIETLAAKYPPGAQVDIHYDPNDPSTAVLETSDEMAQQNGWRIWFFLAGPFLLSGVVAIRNALP